MEFLTSDESSTNNKNKFKRPLTNRLGDRKDSQSSLISSDSSSHIIMT